MSKKTTKKMLIRWGTKFDFYPIYGIEILGKTRTVLERTWNRLGGTEPFDPKKCTKVKITKL